MTLADEVLTGIDWSPFEHCEEARGTVATLLEAEADEERRGRIQLLGDVLALYPDDRENAECPFSPSDLVSELNKGLLAEVAESATKVHLPLAVFSRIIDVAWIRRACPASAAGAAADSYMSVAAASLDPTHWTRGFHYLRRAISLSAEVRRASMEHAKLLDAAASMITTLGDAAPLYFCAKTMGLLIDQRYANGAPLAVLAASLAKQAASQKDYFRAKEHLEIKSAWHRLYKEREAEREVAIKIAELLEEQADHRHDIGETRAAVHHQTEAVVAWRRVGGEGARARKAHARLQELQRGSLDGFTSIEASIDLSSCVTQARERVAGRPLPEAILKLAMIHGPASVAVLKEQARRRMREFLFYSLFPRSTLNASGRTVHASRGGVSDPHDETPDVDEARTDCVRNIGLASVGAIIPAALEIQLEHNVSARDLVGLVQQSAFVPRGRTASFARGLALGFQGEFSLAAHLLMPQFENSLRCAMEARGVVVSTLPDSLIQNEVDLNRLLSMSEMRDFLGEDEHFETETLLVHKAGANLRNELSHGLFDDHARDGLLAYFWWKVLRYVVLLSATAAVADIAGSEPRAVEPVSPPSTGANPETA